MNAGTAFVVMGATGHVGSAVASALLARGLPVVALVHDPKHADPLRAAGADIVVADANDTAALRAAFRQGRRAFLLNPPASTDLDTDAVERTTVATILAALEGSGLEKVVAESTAGAQPGERMGDLSVLWELEEGLRRQSIPAAINRAAYYMSNWDGVVQMARSQGNLPSLFPANLRIPMAAPRDIGEAAAARLVSGLDDVGIHYVEGPARYTPADVARALGEAFGGAVGVEVVPREGWQAAYRRLGFSDAAADAYARMTAASIDQGFALPEGAPVTRGITSLEDYIRGVAEA